MADESTNEQSESRLDRMEKVMQAHIREHSILSADIRKFVDRLVGGQPPPTP